MSKTFSSLLVKDNIVPVHKMEEAIQRQIIFGGRLGTNLLEIGAITESELVHYLAKTKSLRPAQPNHFTNIDPDAIQLFNVETVEQLKMLPIRIHPGNQIDVLVVDPLEDTILDNLTRKTGYNLIQFITSEFRFIHVLNKFFNRELSQRYLRLGKRFTQPLALGAPSNLIATQQHQGRRSTPKSSSRVF